MGKLFVTAFGPFGEFKVNPSAELVNNLDGYERFTLPVEFEQVDRVLNACPGRGYDRLLMLGVSANAETLLIEKVARNAVGETADASGQTRPPGSIIDGGRDLRGCLFKGWRSTQDWKVSTDAGSYLCNYIYYEATRRRPDLATGFVHVPPFDVIPFDRQLRILKRIIARIESKPLTTNHP